jgi:hypothetical protein
MLTGEDLISEFFSILIVFNQYSRNKYDRNLFSNLLLLSRASLIGVTYEGVTSCALSQLASTVAADLQRRSSHAMSEGTTYASVTSSCLL